jgi:hypothetical protein
MSNKESIYDCVPLSDTVTDCVEAIHPNLPAQLSGAQEPSEKASPIP